MPVKARKNSQPLNVESNVNPSNSAVSFPPVPSPSTSSFTSFLNKAAPKKWFSRSPSPRSVSSNAHTTSFGSLAEPRDSTSSRKPKISGPSDPRPILPNASKLGSSAVGSSSVLDLTLKGSPPSMSAGDLRTIYKKGYSRSCDDLSRVTEGQPLIQTTRQQLDTKEKIQMYRQGSYGSAVSVNSPTPALVADTSSLKGYSSSQPVPGRTWPTPPSSPGTSPSSAFPRSGTVPTISVSTPSQGMEFSQQHSRSRSTNLLGALGAGPSAHRKASFEREHRPFPFGDSVVKHSSSMQDIGARAEVRIEPSVRDRDRSEKVKEEEESKRSSQIIHVQGFINRLPSFSAPPLFSGHQLNNTLTSGSLLPPVNSPHPLPKGWKPFKLVLKGSKLYFYKPPHSTISNGIKELFPTQLSDIIEEAIEPLPREAEEMIQQQERVAATTTPRRKRAYWGRGTHPELTVQNGKVVKGSPIGLIHEMVFGTTFGDSVEDWHRFAHAVILTLPLPHSFGIDGFEVEFERCKEYYISGAEVGASEAVQERVQWLDDEYERVWSEPDKAPSNSSAGSSRGFRPRSSSINALTDVLSYRKEPNPTQYGIEESTLPSFPSSLAPPAGLRAPVKKELDTEALIRTDSHTIAACLADMHGRDVKMLQSTPEGNLLSALLHQEAEQRPPAAVALSEMTGTDENPHWLTLFVMQSVFRLSHSSTTLSKTHIRATLLAKWIRIGELSRVKGDEASWRAISAALTSRSLARLEKSWRRMDDSVEDQVRLWVSEQKCSPAQSYWLESDLRIIADSLGSEQLGQGMLEVDSMLTVCDLLKRSHAASYQCQAREGSVTSEEAQQLISTFENMRATIPLRVLDLGSFFPESLVAEPRSRSRYASHFWTRPSAPSPQGLIPLLFPDPLPSSCLLDRVQLYRAKKESLEASPSGLGFINDARMRAVIELKVNGESSTPDTLSRSKQDILLSNLDLPSTSISLYGGDLLLTADMTSRPPLVQAPKTPSSTLITSRPTSLVSTSTRPVSVVTSEADGSETRLARTPSLRVTSRSASALERKVSLVRRSSLPSISQRASMVIPETPENEIPLLVHVHAGSLDCLVDVLMVGIVGVSVVFADDYGEMPLLARSRRLQLDKEDFDSTWWNVFRSFVTPLVFFELLRKRYLAADSKRTSLAQHAGPSIGCLDVVRTLMAWISIGGGMQDILDDQELDRSLRTFLQDSLQSHPDSNLQGGLKDLKQLVTEGAKRPKLNRQAWVERVPTAQNLRFGSEVPNPDTISPQDLVECLNAIVAPGAPLEDFLVASDMLEVQTLDKLGWLTDRELPNHYEDVEIQSLISVMQSTSLSSLLNDIEQESFYKALPPSIRSFIRSHAVISKWALATIIEPGIGLRREKRIQLLLSAIELCRPRPDLLQPCARTFVEAALTSAILSRESRLFHRAWHNVAVSRGCAVDSLANYFTTSLPASRAKDLRTDVGWILERMLEVGSLPDTFDSIQGGMSLVNFTKRRYLCNLVRSTPAKIQQTDYDRLNNMYNQVSKLEFDFRAVQMDAQRENGQWMHTQRRVVRPFQTLVAAQMEKHRRDKHLRDRLLREKKIEQQRREQRQNDINKAMNPRKPSMPVGKSQKSRRAVSSAFFRVMRPISTAFSSENIHAVGQRLTMAELDFVPSSKPSWVINLADAKVAIFNNPERPNTFQLDTEDGDKHLLQAPTKADMAKWLNTISSIARSSASKRLTYTTNLKPKMEDHISARTATSSRDPTAVFGVSLPFLLKREAGSDEIPPGAIPSVITRCLGEVEKRGLQEVGIYRIAGQSSVTTRLRNAFDRDEYVDLSSEQYLDINSICDTIKSYFRLLPEPLFPEYTYWDIIRVMKSTEFDQRLSSIRKLVDSLPPPNFYLLKRLMEHLERVTDFEDYNHMTAAALAIVIAPNIIRAPGNDFGLTMGNMNYTTGFVKTLIAQFHSIFSDIEGEVDEEDIEEVLETVDEVPSGASEEEADLPAPPTVMDAIHDHDSDFDNRSPDRGE